VAADVAEMVRSTLQAFDRIDICVNRISSPCRTLPPQAVSIRSWDITMSLFFV